MPVVIAGLILSFLLLMLFGDSELDRTLLVLLDAEGVPRLADVAGVFHWCARPLPLLVLVVAGIALLALWRQWRDAALLGGISLSGWLLATGVQRLTLPIRPLEGMSPAVGAAYPDSSAATATIACFSLAFLLTRRAPARSWALAAATAFVLAAGASAIMVASTWPSGVVGGWALGLAWTLLILLIARADIGDGSRAR